MIFMGFRLNWKGKIGYFPVFLALECGKRILEKIFENTAFSHRIRTEAGIFEHIFSKNRIPSPVGRSAGDGTTKNARKKF
jgi:hypothetical protein